MDYKYTIIINDTQANVITPEMEKANKIYHYPEIKDGRLLPEWLQICEVITITDTASLKPIIILTGSEVIFNEFRVMIQSNIIHHEDVSAVHYTDNIVDGVAVAKSAIVTFNEYGVFFGGDELFKTRVNQVSGLVMNMMKNRKTSKKSLTLIDAV